MDDDMFPPPEFMILGWLLVAIILAAIAPWYAWNRRHAWKLAMAKRRTRLKARIERDRAAWAAWKAQAAQTAKEAGNE